MEDERFTAAALYNLACSSTGVTSILNAATNAVVGERYPDEGYIRAGFLTTLMSLISRCPALVNP